MDVKEAAQKAKEYLTELFAGEEFTNVGLEEIDFDAMSNDWKITMGFSRPWDHKNVISATFGEGSPARSYKVASVKDRVLTASGYADDPSWVLRRESSIGRQTRAMKKPVLHSVFLALIGLVLSPMADISASSPPADSVHFCAFDSYEQWRRDHPRPAAKRPADLDVGEPRTVRMIYFLPSDWPYRAEVVDSMKTVIKESQTFYREQMQAHGYGDWSFHIENDAQGEPLVHRVDGQHPFSRYDNTLGTAVVAELEQTFDLDANIYFIVLGTDALRQGNGQPVGGVGRRRTKNGGALVVPDRFSFFTVAHELGHTFGLNHDFRDNRYIMSYGFDQREVLSACAAEFLSVHTCFNPDSPIEEGPPPTVEIVSSTRYQPGTTSVPVQLRVNDSEGLHQVGLIGASNWCRGLTGDENAVIKFDYDGNFWERGFSNLSDRASHHLLIIAVDAKGNVSETQSTLVEISPYEIATLEGHRSMVNSVAFSPDGELLASGSGGL